MDRVLFKAACVALVGGALLGSRAQPKFQIVRDGAEVSFARERVLYQQGGSFLLKSESASEEDFDDLYVVNTNNWFALPESFGTYGETLAFEPGRFALMRLSEQKAGEMSHLLHHSGMACGVLVKLDGRPIEFDVAPTPAPLLPVNVRDVRVERAVQKVRSENIKATVEELAAITTRYHSSPTGLQVADLLAAKYDALKGDRSDVTISTYDHGSATPQHSLVVRIEGTTNPSELVVLGSHLDSINGFGGTSRAPGADDNASGTATNLEIFRIMMEEGLRPARTIEIHAYAAEEIGLVGSQNMATRYKDAGVNVVAMVQHDMTIYKAAGAEDKIWFVTSNTDNGFNDLLGQLVDGYVQMAWGKEALSGGTSDHASWRRAGYATAFPFENPRSYNRNIHTSGDTTVNANAWTQAGGFAKLGIAYSMHFAGVN